MSAPAVTLTIRDRIFLEYCSEIQSKGFDAANTTRVYRKSTALGLEARGLVSAVSAVVCDGDGWTVEPERERRAYALTPEGRDRLAEANARMNRSFADRSGDS